MHSHELKQAIQALGLTQKAFAARVSDLSGQAMSEAYISQMCTGRREPSATVRVAARLMLEHMDAQALVDAVHGAGYLKG